MNNYSENSIKLIKIKDFAIKLNKSFFRQLLYKHDGKIIQF